MRKQTRVTKRPSNDAGPFIRDAAELLTAAAQEHRTVHISQSFPGTNATSATIVCLVACPNDLVVEMQDAIDRAVNELLGEHGSTPVTVH